MVMKSIVTGEIYHQCDAAELHLAMRQKAAKAGVIWFGGQIPIDDEHPPLKSRVNHGRWVVDCPECAGAELMDESGLFMCQCCWNGVNDHRFITVVTPKNRKGIEQKLLKRPLPENRNWSPGETIGDLARENKERGVS